MALVAGSLGALAGNLTITLAVALAGAHAGRARREKLEIRRLRGCSL